MGKIEKLKLPKEQFEIFTPLDTSSINKDAFIYLPNLKSLHIVLGRKIPLDLKHMLNLTELCLQNLVYIQANLPIRLEKLSLKKLADDIELEPLKALTELEFLKISNVKSILFDSSQPFDGFSKLTCLKLNYSGLKFNATNSNDACNIINIGTERIEELQFAHCVLDKDDVKRRISFDKMINLKKIEVFTNKLNEIDRDSFRRRITLKDIEINVITNSCNTNNQVCRQGSFSHSIRTRNQ